MLYEHVLVIVGNNIPNIEKTEFFSNIAMVNRASWKTAIEFTDKVLQYLSNAERTIEISKIPGKSTKAILHRTLTIDNHKIISNADNININAIIKIGIYRVDLLHGIVSLIKEKMILK